MPLFGRKRDPGPAPRTTHPITAFWAWWADSGHRLDPSRESAATDELTRLVTAIHPDLTWHFGKGAQAQHRLTVTAGGVAAVRPSAERWLRAAPATSEVWEYRASQEADPESLTNTLRIAGAELDLSRARFAVELDEDQLRVHVGVHHPSFALMAPQARSQVTFLVLDWLVGEDDVERWLGHVEPLVAMPAPTGTADDVRAAVARLAADTEPDSWALARGTDGNGRAFIASWRPGVRWIDAPHLDRHQEVRATYPARPDGMPADESWLSDMRVIEDELELTLGSRGMLVAIVTGNGTRTFHAYTDGEDQNVDAAVADWAARRGLTVTAAPDAAWHAVRPFTG